MCFLKYLFTIICILFFQCKNNPKVDITKIDSQRINSVEASIPVGICGGTGCIRFNLRSQIDSLNSALKKSKLIPSVGFEKIGDLVICFDTTKLLNISYGYNEFEEFNSGLCYSNESLSKILLNSPLNTEYPTEVKDEFLSRVVVYLKVSKICDISKEQDGFNTNYYMNVRDDSKKTIELLYNIKSNNRNNRHFEDRTESSLNLFMYVKDGFTGIKLKKFPMHIVNSYCPVNMQTERELIGKLVEYKKQMQRKDVEQYKLANELWELWAVRH